MPHWVNGPGSRTCRRAAIARARAVTVVTRVTYIDSLTHTNYHASCRADCHSPTCAIRGRGGRLAVNDVTLQCNLYLFTNEHDWCTIGTPEMDMFTTLGQLLPQGQRQKMRDVNGRRLIGWPPRKALWLRLVWVGSRAASSSAAHASASEPNVPEPGPEPIPDSPGSCCSLSTDSSSSF